MSRKDKSPEGSRKPATKLQKASSIGAAVAAIGLLVMQLYVPGDRIEGWNLVHAGQIFLVAVGVASAIGIAWSEIRKPREQK